MGRLFLNYYSKRIIRYFQTRRLAKIITATLFVAVFIGVAFGTFFFFKNGFFFLIQNPVLADVLPLYVYELFLLLISYLVFVSSSITALFRLFSGSDDNWIMASPRFRSFAHINFARVFLSSLWPFVIIAVPALVGLWTVFRFGFEGFIVALVSVAALVGLVVLGVMIVLFVASKILYGCGAHFKKHILTLKNLAFCAALITAFFSYLGWRMLIKTTDVAVLFRATDITQISIDANLIKSSFHFFPSHLSALTLDALGRGEVRNTLLPVATLLALLFLAWIVFRVISRWYLTLWQKLQEGRFQARTDGGRTAAKEVRSFPRYLKTPIGAIFEKEALITMRNMRSVLWFCFLTILWLLQTGLNIIVARQVSIYEVGRQTIPGFVHALQFVTIIFFMSAFVLRFAFPSFSGEGRTAWIVGSAPISAAKLFWAKLLYYAALFVSLGVIVGIINVSILKLPPEITGMFFIALVVGTLYVTVFGVGLGALFPNFGTEDPEALSTSLPGLLLTLGALLHGGAGAFLLLFFLKRGLFAPLIIFETVSIGAVVIFLYCVHRSLKHVEFAKRL